MTAQIYGIRASHPSHAARRMAELKGIPHRMRWIYPGMHPAVVRALGFPGSTVPAMKLDGERIVGSRQIARAFERIAPDPPLFPPEPARADVVAAEEWAERELQPVPTRLIRWMAVRHRDVGRVLAADAGMPLPGVVARTAVPIARHMAGRVGADDAGVASTLAALPGLLDRAEDLIAAGTIGGDPPNAADFQIGTTLRVMLQIADVAPAIERRRTLVDLAARVLPDYPGSRVAPHLPAEWLEPLSAARG